MLPLQFAVLALVAATPSGWPPTAQPGDLSFRPEAKIVDGSLIVTASVRNKRSTPLMVGFGGCVNHDVVVRLYRSPERKQPAVWESDADGMLCTLQLFRTVIGPRKSVTLRNLAAKVSGNGVADSVPDATYFATAEICLSDPRITSGEIGVGTFVVRRH